MSLNLSKLINRPPHGWLDTELGRLAIFYLSVSDIEQLRRDTKEISNGEAFARELTRHTCFPADNLREGRFKPARPCLSEQQTLTLSRKSLESIIEILKLDLPSLDQPSNEQSEDDKLHTLMTHMRHEWEASDHRLIEMMTRAHGRSNQFDAISDKISRLPVLPLNPSTQRTAFDNAIPEIKSVLVEMNELAKSTNEQSSKEARLTKRLAAATLVVSIVALVSAPLSRITCSSLHASPLAQWSDAFRRTSEVMCGYKAGPLSLEKRLRANPSNQ